MEQQQKGRTLYIVLALAFAALIVGGATWKYLANDTATTEMPTATTTDTPTTTTQLQASTKTEIDSSLTDLDTEIASIELEEESEDDTVDF